MARKETQIKNIDILEKKKAELSAYQAQSDNAVAIVTRTIDTLNEINTNIESKISEITAYEEELKRTKTGLTSAMNRNGRIIKNFSSLLDVD